MNERIDGHFLNYSRTGFGGGGGATIPTPPDKGIEATGGTITYYSDSGTRYAVHTFTSTNPFQITATSTNTDNIPNRVDYLVIGGGGAGGDGCGGGGGAGGQGGDAGSNAGGAGGLGLENNYRTGSNVFYAGGGGGTGYSAGGASGGSGSGGDGGNVGGDGAVNTGSGGGAGDYDGPTNNGGAGGPGIIVIRYQA